MISPLLVSYLSIYTKQNKQNKYSWQLRKVMLPFRVEDLLCYSYKPHVLSAEICVKFTLKPVNNTLDSLGHNLAHLAIYLCF